jgi:carnitine 3-dehydrogenase
MTKKKIQTVGVLGTGVIGSGWASLFAKEGMNVLLHDNRPELMNKGRQRASLNLDFLSEQGLINAQVCSEAKDRLLPAGDLADFAARCDYIQESIAEDYEIKKSCYRQLDGLADPSILIGSSTSGLLMTEIQKVMRTPQRAFIAHPFTPPHLVPLVELVPGNKTGPDVLTDAAAFFTSLGKIPVILKKEVPGHIANRLAAALWREAIHLAAEGVADVEDIDKALYAGPGLRWAIMGQHLTYHLGGGEGGYRHFIEKIGNSFEEYWKDMPAWTQIPADAKEKVIHGVQDMVEGREYDELCAERDEKLIAIIKALYEDRSTT